MASLSRVLEYFFFFGGGGHIFKSRPVVHKVAILYHVVLCIVGTYVPDCMYSTMFGRSTLKYGPNLCAMTLAVPTVVRWP
jgi:hypothetical protein